MKKIITTSVFAALTLTMLLPGITQVNAASVNQSVLPAGRQSSAGRRWRALSRRQSTPRRRWWTLSRRQPAARRRWWTLEESESGPSALVNECYYAGEVTPMV